MCTKAAFLISFVSLLVMVCSLPALAATRTWENEAGDNRWDNAVNWSKDKIPGLDDVARIVLSGGDECLIDDAVDASVKKLQVGYNDGTTAFSGDLRMTGGSLFLKNASPVGPKAEGRFYFEGGTVTTNNVPSFGDGIGGIGYLFMSGGVFNVGSSETKRALRIGDEGGKGFATISDGVVNAYGNLVIGRVTGDGPDGPIGSEGLLSLLGGIINVGSEASASDLSIGKQYATGTLDISGGQINVIGDLLVGETTFQIIQEPYEEIPRPGTGFLKMTGGILSVADSNNIKIGTNLSTGHVDLWGGTLMGGNLEIGEPGSGGSLDIRGGTLILEGNQMAEVLGYIGDGRMTAYGGWSGADWQYDFNVRNEGKTTVTAIPEPATLLLLGLGGLGLLRRRRA